MVRFACTSPQASRFTERTRTAASGCVSPSDPRSRCAPPSRLGLRVVVAPKSKSGSTQAYLESSTAVDEFLVRLVHPQRDAIQAIRHIIRGADAAIGEGIKWNTPSFRTTEYFATIHRRTKSGVGVVLHLGAAARNNAGMPIDDPRGLLQWLAKDRAMVTFGDAADVLARGPAFERIVRPWIRHV